MKKIGLILLPIITIILETLPSGAVLVFAASPADRIKETFSYFSLLPLGYANVSPFITAILTCVMLLMAITSIKKQDMIKKLFLLSLCTTLFSILPLMYGIDYITPIGVLITITLIIESYLSKTSL